MAVEEPVQPDYVNRFDWCEGEVGDNVKHVLSGLMGTEVSLPKRLDSSGSVRETNPIISIRMRHQRVKERRKMKDHAHNEAILQQKRREEVHRRANEMMRREEEERKRRERQEEEAIKTHVVAIKAVEATEREGEVYLVGRRGREGGEESSLVLQC